MSSASAPQYVDTHCHVDLSPRPAALVRSLDANRIRTIAVTNAPSVFAHTEELAKNSRYLLPAIGLHPELVATHHGELDRFWSCLERTRFVGEVGLDYSTPDGKLRARQRRVFAAILERSAKSGDKIITVHSRRSASDVIATIGDRFPGTVILHWFTGSQRELERAVRIGCYFSINRAMLDSGRGRGLVASIPQDRVLTESDAPFVRSSPTEPGPLSVISTTKALSALWRTGHEEAANTIAATFTRITSKAARPLTD